MHGMEHASSPVIGLIVTLYLVFAYQMWHFRDEPLTETPEAARNRARVAVHTLIVVFVFCAFAGYASSLLPHNWWWAREAMHWVLAAASGWLVWSNAAKSIAAVLR